MTQEEKFARQAADMATSIASIYYALVSWKKVYWDRGYSETLTDEQLAAIGLTKDDVVGMLTFTDALETFMAANMGYVSKARNDI